VTARSKLRVAFQSSYAKLGDNAPARIVTLATLAIVALGIWLRLRGMFGRVIPFWLDESDWAMMLVDQPLTAHAVRPIGFMAVSKALAYVFGPSEVVLRALPLAGGVGATVLAPFLAQRLFQWAGARLLFVSLIALHPGAIDLAKEFKPYSLGLALHLALMLLTLRYVATARGSHLVQALVLTVPAVIFTQDVIFAYPGAFLALGITALRAKNLRHVTYVSLAAALTLALIIGLYFLMWSHTSETDTPTYWGGKYDVFYVADPGHPEDTHLGWTLHKYAEVTGLPGMRSKFWHHVIPRASVQLARDLNGTFWFCLHVLGLLVIAFRRRFYEPLLLVLPLLVSIAFNWLGRFPFGVFRTDLFLLAYIAPIAAIAIDRSRLQAASWSALVPVTLVVLAPLFAFERGWHKEKGFFAVSGCMPQILQTLLQLSREGGAPHPSLVLMDPRVFPQWNYYTKYHPHYARLIEESAGFNAESSDDIDHFATSIRNRLRRVKEPVWILSGETRLMRRAQRGVLKGLNIRLKRHTQYISLYQTHPR
jgi:hypothetical protein